MKKFSTTAIITLALLSSACSKDKNEMQPQLGSAERVPVNQYNSEQNLPQMLDMPQANPYSVSTMAPDGGQGQAEVFLNQSVGLGMAQSAAPQNLSGGGVYSNITEPPAPALLQPQAPLQPQASAQPAQWLPTSPAPVAPVAVPPAPMPMVAAQVTPMGNVAATPPLTLSTPSQGSVIATNKKVPASLLPSYNNPFNYITPPMPVMMGQPMMDPYAYGQPGMQPMAGGNMIQPVYAPTIPVQDMQMITKTSN